MKLLLRTTNWKTTSHFNLYLFDKELSNFCNVEYAGPYWKNWIEEESLKQTIKRLYSNDEPDWVLTNLNEKIPESRNFKVAIYITDIHRDTKELLERVNNSEVDLVFMRAPYLHSTIYCDYTINNPNYFIDNLKCDVVFMPFSIDSDVFKPSNKRIYDISLLGNAGKAYPLRSLIKSELPEFCKSFQYKYFIGSRLTGFKRQGFLNEYKKDKNIQLKYKMGDEYIKTLGQSKIFIFDSAVTKYPVKKYFEAMSCQTCVFSDEPQLAEKLKFKNKFNYILINKDNWKKLVNKYIDNNEKREKIAKNGRETVLKYHTNKIRAKQMVDVLEGKESDLFLKTV